MYNFARDIHRTKERGGFHPDSSLTHTHLLSIVILRLYQPASRAGALADLGNIKTLKNESRLGLVLKV